MYTMKKKNPFFVFFLLIVLSVVACNFHGHRTKTVKVNNDNDHIKIEYCGAVTFADDGMAIEDIAPNGYIKYNNNGRRVYAESDEDGVIRYKLYDGNRRLHMSDPEAHEFMSHAVQVMEEYYNR
jgi:hypothetical protein